MNSSRIPRLYRSLETIALAGIRSLLKPSWTRDFLAHVYTYRPFDYSPRIRRATLPEILPAVGKIPVTLRKCFPRHGNMTGEEIITICLLVQWIRPRGIFEFGTFNGNTTLQMALNAPEDCKIATLNLPLDHSETRLESSMQDKLVHPSQAGSGDVFRGEPEAARIQELFGDSATFDYSPFKEGFDFVLVDAGHEYDYVKSDTKKALELMPASGGVVVWHDFPNAPGVCQWLEEFSEKKRSTTYPTPGSRSRS